MNKNISLILLISFFSVIFFAWRLKANSLEINIEKFIELYKEQNLQLIDVRTAAEYKNDGHVKKAYLVPLNRLTSEGKDSLPRLDKKKPVYIICRSGNRSLVAAKILLSLGFTEVYSVKGGTTAWIIQGQKVEYGKRR